jgi:hypothetical protein
MFLAGMATHPRFAGQGVGGVQAPPAPAYFLFFQKFLDSFSD